MFTTLAPTAQYIKVAAQAVLLLAPGEVCDSDCGYLLLLLLTYIRCQKKYSYSLLRLSRVIRELLFNWKSLIDILTLNPKHPSTV